MKTLVELREMSVTQLNEHILQLRKMQFDNRMMKANGTLDKTHQTSFIRKAIAQVKTIITEKGGDK